MSQNRKLEEKLENAPEWIKRSEIWKNWRDYEFSENGKLYLYDSTIKSLKDFKNVIKAISFWKIEKPYPYDFWKFILEHKNDEYFIVSF